MNSSPWFRINAVAISTQKCSNEPVTACFGVRVAGPSVSTWQVRLVLGPCLSKWAWLHEGSLWETSRAPACNTEFSRYFAVLVIGLFLLDPPMSKRVARKTQSLYRRHEHKLLKSPALTQKAQSVSPDLTKMVLPQQPSRLGNISCAIPANAESRSTNCSRTTAGSPRLHLERLRMSKFIRRVCGLPLLHPPPVLPPPPPS